MERLEDHQRDRRGVRGGRQCAATEPLRSALEALEARAHGVEVLGTFPSAG
jgi:hypothetical protein